MAISGRYSVTIGLLDPPAKYTSSVSAATSSSSCASNSTPEMVSVCTSRMYDKPLTAICPAITSAIDCSGSSICSSHTVAAMAATCQAIDTQRNASKRNRLDEPAPRMVVELAGKLAQMRVGNEGEGGAVVFIEAELCARRAQEIAADALAACRAEYRSGCQKGRSCRQSGDHAMRPFVAGRSASSWVSRGDCSPHWSFSDHARQPACGWS